jgi:hypothetical protein
MSDKFVNISLKAISAVIKTSLVTLCGCALVICITVPGALMAQDPSTASAILSASAQLADSLPRDIVRLSLQVAISSILALVVVIGAGYKLLTKMAAKPCMMSTEDGHAIMRDKMYMAHKDAMSLVKQEDK